MSRGVFALMLALLSVTMASANVPPLAAVITAASPDLRAALLGRK